MPFSDHHLINNLDPSYNFRISSSDMFEHPEDKLLASGPVWHGVAIGWRKDAGLSIQPLQSTNERIIGLRILLSQSSLVLVSLYAPTSGHDEDFLETISNLSEYLHTNCSQADQVVIGADSNCSTKSSSRRQVAWHNFCEKYSLVIHSSQLPTFHHHNGSSSTFIDVFAASNTLEMGDTRHYCTLDTPLNLSSHDPIENNVVIALENSGEETKYTDTYTDFQRQKIIWEPSNTLQTEHSSMLYPTGALQSPSPSSLHYYPTFWLNVPH